MSFLGGHHVIPTIRYTVAVVRERYILENLKVMGKDYIPNLTHRELELHKKEN